jgi:hypothetical protein
MTEGEIYEFAFRGILAEEGLDRAGREPRMHSDLFNADVAAQLSLYLLDESHVGAATRIAAVYAAVAAFENSVRQLVTVTLRESVGDDWWEQAVSGTIQKQCKTRQEDEGKHRFHTKRGDSPINYTDMKNLSNIIRTNWESFSDFLPSAEWATAIFDTIERSRNVIMHSGSLDAEDVARVGTNLREWVKQVGA